jgi:hypothetical protein
LEIDNLHSAECGALPSLDAAGKYVGYFEGGCGDQWVFVGDRNTGEAVVRGGDVDWPTGHKVSRERPCPAGLVLGEDEKHWIITCFMAMSNAPYDAVASDFAAGDFLAAALGITATLSEGPTVKPPDRHGRNGTNGDHRKDGRREE